MYIYTLILVEELGGWEKARNMELYVDSDLNLRES